MLRASAQLLKPGGRTAFFTIHLTPGLSADDIERAAAAAPPAVVENLAPDRLLVDAGLTDVEAVDVTADFREIQNAWYQQWQRHAAHLRKLLGDEVFDDRQEERERTLGAIDDGLIRRTLCSATRP